MSIASYVLHISYIFCAFPRAVLLLCIFPNYVCMLFTLFAFPSRMFSSVRQIDMCLSGIFFSVSSTTSQCVCCSWELYPLCGSYVFSIFVGVIVLQCWFVTVIVLWSFLRTLHMASAYYDDESSFILAAYGLGVVLFVSCRCDYSVSIYFVCAVVTMMCVLNWCDTYRPSA